MTKTNTQTTNERHNKIKINNYLNWENNAMHHSCYSLIIFYTETSTEERLQDNVHKHTSTENKQILLQNVETLSDSVNVNKRCHQSRQASPVTKEYYK